MEWELVSGHERIAALSAVSEAHSWAWATLLQIDRVEKSFYEEQRVRERFEAPDIQLALKREADSYFLLTAANHVVTATKKCKRRWGVPRVEQDLSNAITALRDLYEHWDKTKGAMSNNTSPIKAWAKLLETHPDAAPFGFSWDTVQGVVIARSLKLNDLRNSALEIEEITRKILDRLKQDSART